MKTTIAAIVAALSLASLAAPAHAGIKDICRNGACGNPKIVLPH